MTAELKEAHVKLIFKGGKGELYNIDGIVFAPNVPVECPAATAKKLIAYGQADRFEGLSKVEVDVKVAAKPDEIKKKSRRT